MVFTRSVLVCTLILVIQAGIAQAGDAGAFTVGQLTAARGQSLSGYLDVAAAEDGGTRIPVSLLHGALTERIAAVITQQVIEQADYLVDLHGGDGNESLRPYVYLPGLVWLQGYEVIRSPLTGIFRPAVRDGYAVARGTLLGHLLDEFGDPAGEVRAPFAGIVNYVLGTPPVSQGEPLAMVSRIVGETQP